MTGFCEHGGDPLTSRDSGGSSPIGWLLVFGEHLHGLVT
jgi:hypothetical protein